MSSELPAPVHVLSKKSSALHRDTFVFWPFRAVKLLVGLNQRVTPVTGAKLHRWIRIIDPATNDFELRPVALKQRGPLTYVAKPTGPTVSSESTMSLLPGDYGWFNPDGYDSPPFFQIRSGWSFADAKRYAEQDHMVDWHENLNLYVFPPDFEQSVLLRDNQCFITGTEASPTNPDLGVSWVVPPAWVDQLTHPREPSRSEITSFINVSNACVMRQDIIALFHDNAFGIDVDDNYRIVVFRDIESVTLPSNLRRPRACAGPDDKFLRAHFRWCLRVHLLGGDIREDYDSNAMAHAAEELGLCGDDPEIAPLDDERWHTILGKELLEHHLSSELAFARNSESEE